MLTCPDNTTQTRWMTTLCLYTGQPLVQVSLLSPRKLLFVLFLTDGASGPEATWFHYYVAWVTANYCPLWM